MSSDRRRRPERRDRLGHLLGPAESFEPHGQARGAELDGTTRVNAARSEFWIAREQAERALVQAGKG
jgi:hypothetical protein